MSVKILSMLNIGYWSVVLALEILWLYIADMLIDICHSGIAKIAAAIIGIFGAILIMQFGGYLPFVIDELFEDAGGRR